MGLSEYYKSRPYKEWIEDWELGIDEEDGQAFFYHTAPTWLSIRDLIHEAGLDNHPKVIELDKKAIINAIRNKADPPYDREYEGLDRWWWHLDKIAEGTFPPELLPEHLRDTYLKAR